MLRKSILAIFNCEENDTTKFQKYDYNMNNNRLLNRTLLKAITINLIYKTTAIFNRQFIEHDKDFLQRAQNIKVNDNDYKIKQQQQQTLTKHLQH